MKASVKNHWIIRNLGLAVLLVVVLIVGASISLNLITRHGKYVTTPDFTNMSIAEAKAAAAEAKVGIKVTDSIFVKGLDGGVVYRQSPEAGATVKKGRSIFLTINSIVPKKIAMPNLINYSFSEARAELRNRGLSVGHLKYMRDIATNRVLHQSMNGREIPAGEKVVSGSSIDLTLGLASSGSTSVVPRLLGMKYIHAQEALHNKCFNVGRVHCDKDIRSYADSTNAMVWRQDDMGAVKSLGTPVDIWLTLDASKVPAND